MEIVSEFEERSIEFYEKLLDCKIYDKESIKQFQAKRAKFIQRVTSKHATAKEYFDFICSERKLCNLVEKKGQNLVAETDDERNKIINRKLRELKDDIYKNVVRLYLEAIKRDTSSIKLWRNFLSYIRKKRPHEATKYYERMLTFFPLNDRCWTEAALWNYEFHRDYDIFEDFIKRGLAVNSLSTMLHKAQFDVALYEANAEYQKICEGLNSVEKFGETLRRVEQLYKNSQEKIKGHRFCLGVLERCTADMFEKVSMPIQIMIIDDVMEKYPHNEDVWCHLAKREYMGYNMSDLRKVFRQGEADPVGIWMEKVRLHYEPENQEKLNLGRTKEIVVLPPIWLKRTEKHRFFLCFKVYEMGLKTLKTRKICREFINTMLEFNEDVTEDTNFKRKHLAIAFKQCHESGLLSEKHYCIFLRLLLATETGKEAAEQILEDVCKNFKSLTFFELWISYYIEKNVPDMVEKVHAKAWKELGVKSASIFQLAICYYKTRYDEDKRTLLRIFEDAIKVNNPEFGMFRVQFLEFCALNMSRDTLRMKYDEMAQLPPPCLDLHKKMAEVEMHVFCKTNDYVERRRKVYENMVMQFGDKDRSVWYDYLKFEELNGDPTRVPLLYQRAKFTLSTQLFGEFEKEYVILKSKWMSNK